MMLGYLSKFVLQMLPTISATVIGAYIVTTWINPKTPADPAKIAAQQAAKAVPAAEELAVPDAPVAPAPVATKSAEAAEATKPAETSKPDKEPAKAASAPDSVRIIPIVKQPAAAAELPVTAPASAPPAETVAAAEERKNANELARAAIQRLRGGSESAHVMDGPVKPAASAIRVQQARVAPEPLQASPLATVAPPLPPAVSIASPRYSQIEVADQLAPGQPERPTPPGEIPTERQPLGLQASHRVGENPSFADDFVSATKSFFRAITPQ
jgi:hypothetical protein